jgi:Ca2+-binding RTX toxin-like protein
VEGLIGSSFNDTLGSTGGVGGAPGYPEIPHTLVGGAGNDIYVLEAPWGHLANGWVEVVEAAGQGVDEMRTSTRSTLVLAANVENLTNLGAGDFTGTGNALANVMTGGSGNDMLEGRDGADTFNGGGGADTLVGGAGVDRLTGGVGADLFVFGALDALPATGGIVDQITDFATGSDRLRIGVTGAVQGLSAETSFATALTSASAALGAGASNIVTVAAGSTTYVFADTNNDNLVDTAIALTGTTAPVVSASDFV